MNKEIIPTLPISSLIQQRREIVVVRLSELDELLKELHQRIEFAELEKNTLESELQDIERAKAAISLKLIAAPTHEVKEPVSFEMLIEGSAPDQFATLILEVLEENNELTVSEVTEKMNAKTLGDEFSIYRVAGKLKTLLAQDAVDYNRLEKKWTSKGKIEKIETNHLTYRELILQTLSRHKRGMTAQGIREFIYRGFGRKIPRESLAPQLSALARKNILTHDGQFWKLTRAN